MVRRRMDHFGMRAAEGARERDFSPFRLRQLFLQSPEDRAVERQLSCRLARGTIAGVTFTDQAFAAMELTPPSLFYRFFEFDWYGVFASRLFCHWNLTAPPESFALFLKSKAAPDLVQPAFACCDVGFSARLRHQRPQNS